LDKGGPRGIVVVGEVEIQNAITATFEYIGGHHVHTLQTVNAG
jgi:hypothetical protein